MNDEQAQLVPVELTNAEVTLLHRSLSCDACGHLEAFHSRTTADAVRMPDSGSLYIGTCKVCSRNCTVEPGDAPF